MQNLLTGILFLCSLTAVSGISKYKAGDKLFVLTTTGLSLREAPDISSAKMMTIKNGAPLVVLKEDLNQYPFSLTEFDGYELTGYWVKVLTWDNKTGYVFDGYLSRYQAPKKVILKEHINEQYVIAEQYMMVHSKRKGKRVPLPVASEQFIHYKQAFVNGASVEVNAGEGYASYTILFDKMTTFEEAYLIGRALWFDGKPAQLAFDDGIIRMSNAENVLVATVSLQNNLPLLTLTSAD
jgi:hypothetical protein